jgi:hypothetical protein
VGCKRGGGVWWSGGRFRSSGNRCRSAAWIARRVGVRDRSRGGRRHIRRSQAGPGTLAARPADPPDYDRGRGVRVDWRHSPGPLRATPTVRPEPLRPARLWRSRRLKLARFVIGGLAGAYITTALYERLAPRRMVRGFRNLVGNPLSRPSAGIAPGWAVIETVGRRSGLPRQVPVGGRLRGDCFWLVAADGRRAHYVRNIECDPRCASGFITAGGRGQRTCSPATTLAGACCG